MKGPRGRVTYIVRRWWLCPRCGRRTWTSGATVNLACTCAGSGPPVAMQLVEGKSNPSTGGSDPVAASF